MRALNIIITAALVLLAIDFIAFGMWIASGQTPPDGVYIGRLTSELLALIIS